MKKNEWFVPWVFISILLVGMYRSFCDVFGYSQNVFQSIALNKMYVRKEAMVYLILLFVAAVTVFAVYSLQAKLAAEATVVLVMAAGGFAILNLGHLKKGITYLVWLYEVRMAEYTASSIPDMGDVGRLAPSANYLLVIAAFLCVLFLAFFVYRFHSRGYLLVFDTVAISMGMVFGRVPEGKTMVLLIVGTVASLIWISFHEKGGRLSFEIVHKKAIGRKSIVYGMSGFFCVCTIILGLLFAQKYSAKLFKDADMARKKNEQMMASLSRKGEELFERFFMTTGVDNDGSLSNKEPNYTENTVLKVNLPKPPTEDVYLKGFIGDTYADGKWTSSGANRDDTFMQPYEIVNNIWDLGYHNISEYGEIVGEESVAASELESYTPSMMTTSMRIDYVGAGKNSKYAYLPYYSAIDQVYLGDEEAVAERIDSGDDFLLKVHGDNYCEKAGDQLLLNSYIDTTEAEKKMYRYLYFGDDDDIDYGEMNIFYYTNEETYQQYKHYAQNAYTTIPTKGLERYVQYVKEHPRDTENLLNITQYVRTVLWENASYSFDLKSVPKGTDYADYFLFTQHKGFCEHFATAGTLLLRAYGVPSRYVTGYRIDADDFKKDASGGYTAEVKDSDSHAWSEIFIDKMGWVRQEMTPSGGVKKKNVNNVQTATPKPATPTPTVKKKKPQKNEVTPTPTVEPTKAPEALGDDTSGDKHNMETIRNVVLITGGIIILIVLLLLLLRGKCRYLYKSMQQTQNRNKKLRKRTKLFYQFLREAGVPERKNQTDLEWLRGIGRQYASEIPEQDIEQMIDLIQRAAFSKQMIAPEEVLQFEEKARWMEKLFYAKASRLRKILIKLKGYRV